MRILLLFAPLLAGILNAFQGSINSILGKKIGIFEASLVNFSVGTAVLLVVTLIFGRGHFGLLFSVPKWQWIGGILGAIYVTIVVLMVPRIGIASVLVMIIAGQLLMSAVIDNYGLFGSAVIPFDWKRLLSLILMGMAVFLFYYRRA